MADLAITPSEVVHGPDCFIEWGRAGEAIDAGEAVYRHATTKFYMLAASTENEEAAVRGLAACSASAGQPLAIVRGGPVDVGAGVPGATYFLSQTPGKLCDEADVESGYGATVIGTTSLTSSLFVSILPRGIAAPIKGVPNSITVDGMTYTRIRFGGVPLDIQISSQPLYGRAA